MVPDENGSSTRKADAHGRYEFVVSPTDYDAMSDVCLTPREHRTTVELPAGHRLSAAEGVAAQRGGARAVPLFAASVNVDEEGREQWKVLE